MPITALKTISKSRVVAADQGIELPAEQQAAFYTLMESFLLLNPSPSDDQMHQLTTSTGMDPETFEQLVYQCFGSLLHPDASAEQDDEEVLSDADEPEEEDDLLSDEGGSELLTDAHEHEDLMSRLVASNVDDNTADPVNRDLFNLNDLEPIEASDPDGRAAENDGIPDPELLGGEDPLKEASESDGAVDEELVQETLDNMESS